MKQIKMKDLKDFFRKFNFYQNLKKIEKKNF